MPTPAPLTTQGTTVAFGTSGFVARVTGIDGPNVTRDPLETTHLGSTVAKEFIPNDLYEWEMTLNIQWDPRVARPPITGSAEVVTLTYTTGSTSSGSCFVTGFNRTGAVGALLTGTVSLKGSGALTDTP